MLAYSTTSDDKMAHLRAALRVGPKSPLNASKMLDGGRHRLALFSYSGTISAPTQPRVLMLNRP